MPKLPNPARTSGSTVSSWFGTSPTPPTFEPLQKNTTTDVVIVGGGIAGLTTAYLLGKAGRKVLLLEDGELASGESGRTTAHLSYALDDRYTTLENLFGKEGARLAAESHSSAIDLIEQIVLTEQIDCDFTRLDGYLFLHADGKPKDLRQELEAAHRAGLADVEHLPNANTLGFEPGECLRWPNQGQFHILKYLNGLAQAIVLQGGRICTHTRVTEVHGGSTLR